MNPSSPSASLAPSRFSQSSLPSSRINPAIFSRISSEIRAALGLRSSSRSAIGTRQTMPRTRNARHRLPNWPKIVPPPQSSI